MQWDEETLLLLWSRTLFTNSSSLDTSENAKHALFYVGFFLGCLLGYLMLFWYVKNVSVALDSYNRGMI
jgi:hypothetical protein